MATFLYKAAVGLALLQGPAPASDTLRAELWARVTADSTDGPAWLELGRFYLQRSAEYHAHRHPVVVDTIAAHGTLDTAQLAFDRAIRWSPGTRTADSARVFRVYSVGEKAHVDWESGGTAAATLTWHTLPETLRLPPVLEELGENLLRACPHQGLLRTAGRPEHPADLGARDGDRGAVGVVDGGNDEEHREDDPPHARARDERALRFGQFHREPPPRRGRGGE